MELRCLKIVERGKGMVREIMAGDEMEWTCCVQRVH